MVANRKTIQLLNTTQTKEYNYLNYPVLNREAQSETFKNYQKFASTYNAKAKELDKEIIAYNDQLVKCNDNEMVNARYFMKTRVNMPAQQYNEQVEQFNNMFGKVLVPKKRIPKLTPGHKNLMQAIVYYQAGQLHSKTQFNNKLGVSSRINKNEISFEAASHEIANVKDENGSKVYEVHPKTVRNHLSRLKELGLLKVTFQGSNNPYKIKISNEILVVIDGNSPKRLNTENQFFNTTNSKNLTDKDNTTGTKNNNRIKTAKNIFAIIEKSNINVAHNSFAAQSYGNTSGISKEFKSTGGGIFYENFAQKIENPKNLAQKLANNEFVDYKPIGREYYTSCLYNASISNEELKQLILQDLLKQASKIYQNHNKLEYYNQNAMVGSWLIAMEEFNDYYLVDQGSKSTYKKDHLIKLLVQFRWRIKQAAICFKNNNWFALFPSQYFDRTRKSPSDVAFQGTRFMWNRHISKIEIKSKRTQKQLEAEKQRKQVVKWNDQYSKAIKKYVFGKKTLDWLFNYVNNSNLPLQYKENLPKNIKYFQEKFNNKAA